MAQVLDLEGLQSAWVEPDGTLHPVKLWGHDEFARDRQTYYGKLKDQGWITLSEGDWPDNRVTQKQLDVIYDWHVANRRKFNPESFSVQ